MAEGNNWTRVSSLPANFDLDLLVLALNRSNISYRLTERGKDHELWLENADQLGDIEKLVAQIKNMTAVSKVLEEAQSSSAHSKWLYLSLVPVTVITLILGVLGQLVVSYFPEQIHWFTFVDFKLANGGRPEFIAIEETFAAGEYWRFFTPVFLHFGLFHVVFNSLWLWEFGRRVERVTGRISYLVLILALASGSNAGQYLWSGAVLFGGLSGVVYGLIGYVWIRNRIAPQPLLNVAPGVIYVMLGWLLVCLLGIVDLFIQGGVANGAHVSGLLIGMLAGALAARQKPQVNA